MNALITITQFLSQSNTGFVFNETWALSKISSAIETNKANINSLAPSNAVLSVNTSLITVSGKYLTNFFKYNLINTFYLTKLSFISNSACQVLVKK